MLICSAGASYPGMHPLQRCFHAQPSCHLTSTQRAGRFLEQDLEVFESTMDVNFYGTVRVLKAALPSMVDRREGEVVLISSAAAVCGALCKDHCCGWHAPRTGHVTVLC